MWKIFIRDINLSDSSLTQGAGEGLIGGSEMSRLYLRAFLIKFAGYEMEQLQGGGFSAADRESSGVQDAGGTPEYDAF